WFSCSGVVWVGVVIGAAYVFDRIVLFRVVFFALAWSGIFPRLLVTFAILDPALGVIAWYLIAKEQPTNTSTPPG
ncbi:MAG: hypothetical protein ACK6DC_13285, partial [Planctomycetota bacterium]